MTPRPACEDTGDRIDWFPENYAGSTPLKRYQPALDVCATCPLTGLDGWCHKQWLQWRPTPDCGVWFGTTPADRKQMREKREGHPPVPPSTKAEIMRLKRGGEPVPRIAGMLGLHERTVYRIIERESA